MLTIAYDRTDAAATREAFTVTAQSLGVPPHGDQRGPPPREVYGRAIGWRMVDLGGCGSYEPGPHVHTEIRPTPTRRQDNLSPTRPHWPTSSTPAGPAPYAVTIAITDLPASIQRGVPFNVAGDVASEAAPCPRAFR